MKTTRKAGTWRLAVVIALAFVAGCSDGELFQGGAGLTPDITPLPLIISFTADPAQVTAGESTTISWEVADADTVQITAVSADGSSVGFNVETSELSGSAPAANLTATTDFIITATKTMVVAEDGAALAGMKAEGTDEAPVGQTSSSQTITVSVVAPTVLSASITADLEQVNAGEQTVIRWTVDPAANVNVDVAADSGEPVLATDQCAGDLQSILDASTQNPLDPKPAIGCAVVAPAAASTYTVTATDANDAANQASAGVLINVSQISLEIGSFTVNKQENASVLNYNDPISLEWLVSPAGALVTITANPAVDAAKCALPVDQPSTGELQTLSCTVAADTTFTVSAKMNETTAPTRVANVALKTSASADLKITTDGWAFPGEEVEIKIEPAANNAAAITKITIDDAAQATGRVELAGFQGVNSIIQKVRVPKLGVRVRWQCQGCAQERDAQVVNPMLAAPKVFMNAKGAAYAITRVAAMPKTEGVFLYGVNAGSYNSGKAYIFKSGYSLADELMMTVGFGSMLDAGFVGQHMNPQPMENMTFAVEAIAAKDSGRVYAGVPGALMYSDDAGATWNLMESFPRLANRQHPYKGTHPACAGEEQKGMAYDGNDTMIVAFGSVCDIVSLGDDHVMIATDRGVWTQPSVAAFLKNKNDNPWRGKPTQNGSSGEGAEFLTYTRVVNDLEVVGSKVFAAAAAGTGTLKGGVFVSVDQGLTWQDFGLADVDVYSLTYDAQKNKIYAGTKTGVMVSGIDSASWNEVAALAKPVFSIAVDPYSQGGVLIAGTDTGISILRNVDSNETAWKTAAVDSGSEVGKVRALAIASMVKDQAGVVDHYLSIGTSKGLFAGSVQVKVSGVVTTTPPAEQPPAEQPQQEEAPQEETPPQA